MEKFTFFWRNRSPFSQWYPSRFTVDGIVFTRAEQYMMYRKAILFGDNEIAKQILKTDDPEEQKELGRKVRGFVREIWDRHKEAIVYNGNYEKFRQNPKLKEALFATVGTTLVEASPYDKVWGIRLTEDDPRALSRQTWRGENLLGEILTKVRDDMIRKGE